MADTTVKIFNSAMTGAPSLANVAGNLIAVLDACLVNGFGLKTCDSVVISGGVGTATISTGHSFIPDSVAFFAGATPSGINGEKKVLTASTNVFTFDATGIADGTATGTITVKLAPAGWAKTFSGTNLAAYKSSNVQATGNFLRVDDTTTTYASVRGYEAMTDINTGSGIFPTAAQQATNVWQKSDNAAARQWWLIANDRFFYFGAFPFNSYLTHCHIYAFGDTIARRSGDPYRAALFAVNNTAQSIGYQYNPVAATAGTYHSKYMPRSYSALGSPVGISQAWLESAASNFSGYGGRTFPNPADNGIVFTPVLVTEGNTYRAELPGIFATPQAIGSGILDDQRIANTPGYARTLVYKQWSYDNSGRGGVFFDLTGPWNV